VDGGHAAESRGVVVSDTVQAGYAHAAARAKDQGPSSSVRIIEGAASRCASRGELATLLVHGDAHDLAGRRGYGWRLVLARGEPQLPEHSADGEAVAQVAGDLQLAAAAATDEWVGLGDTVNKASPARRTPSPLSLSLVVALLPSSISVGGSARAARAPRTRLA
jgi:hypothetical protein